MMILIASPLLLYDYIKLNLDELHCKHCNFRYFIVINCANLFPYKDYTKYTDFKQHSYGCVELMKLI